MDANLLKKNISSVTTIDSFLNHFWQWNMHCWTPIQGRGAQYYIKELDDDALEEKNEWTASRLCIVCSNNYFQYSKNCWLFIHVYLKQVRILSSSLSTLIISTDDWSVLPSQQHTSILILTFLFVILHAMYDVCWSPLKNYQ